MLYVEGNYGWANRLKTLLAMKNVMIMQHNEGAQEWYFIFVFFGLFLFIVVVLQPRGRTRGCVGLCMTWGSTVLAYIV